MQFSFSLRKITPRMYLIESLFLLFSNFLLSSSLNISIKKNFIFRRIHQQFCWSEKRLNSLQCWLHTSMSVGLVGIYCIIQKIQGMLANITCYIPTLLWITTKLSVGTVRGVGKYHHPMCIMWMTACVITCVHCYMHCYMHCCMESST